MADTSHCNLTRKILCRIKQMTIKWNHKYQLSIPEFNVNVHCIVQLFSVPFTLIGNLIPKVLIDLQYLVIFAQNHMATLSVILGSQHCWYALERVTF